MPTEHGWHRFTYSRGNDVEWEGTADVVPSTFFSYRKIKPIFGYLVGDRIIPDGAVASVGDALRIVEQAEPVYLLEPGLERFARISVARWEDGRLIYIGQEFPLGPEGAVTEAFQDH
jgi:hypothetical protein